MGGDLLVVTLPLFSSRYRAENAAIAPAFLVIQTHSAGHEFSGRRFFHKSQSSFSFELDDSVCGKSLKSIDSQFARTDH
jgi:hypothetical protein